METQVADDALVAVRVLSEDVLNHDHDFFDYVLGCHLGPDEFLQGEDTALGSWLNFDGDYTNSRDCFTGESDIDLLGVVLQLGEQLVNVGQVSQTDHEFQLGKLDVEGVLEVAEEDADFSFKDLWVLHQNQVDVACGHVLDLWSVVHQGDQRRRKLAANRATAISRLVDAIKELEDNFGG